jgi:hypothetical protein
VWETKIRYVLLRDQTPCGATFTLWFYSNCIISFVTKYVCTCSTQCKEGCYERTVITQRRNGGVM